MPSQRNDLKLLNKNDSKNTRMDFSKNKNNMDYRKDEFMHLARYQKAVDMILKRARAKGKPIKVLDIGCGEMNPAKMLYKAVVCKKEDIIREYIGVDIDYIMAEKAMENNENAYQKTRARFLIQDMTVKKDLPFPDNYFDIVISFEFFEHIQPVFLPGILKEMRRVLKVNGDALFSTPNSNGSNRILPKDHIYEYSYEEVLSMLNSAGYKILDTSAICINLSKLSKEEKEKKQIIIKKYEEAFGNSAFFAVAIAPMFEPRYSKNVLYHAFKQGD